MYDAHILTDIGCRSLWDNGIKTGYAVNITINYYRGVPLCCIEEISLEVDGEEVDQDLMFLQLKGKELPYKEIHRDDFPTDFYWNLGELMRIVVRKQGGIKQGIHHVRLTLGTRRSYTDTMVNTCEKDLTFA